MVCNLQLHLITCQLETSHFHLFDLFRLVTPGSEIFSEFYISVVNLFCLQISDGERLTLALWFSRDSSHDEDAKLLSLLSERLSHSSNPKHNSWLPLPASSNMYWFFPAHASDDQLGFDICWARLHILGFDVLYSRDNGCYSDISELLIEPLHLARGNELFEMEFVNMLHALQVLKQCSFRVRRMFGLTRTKFLS